MRIRDLLHTPRLRLRLLWGEEHLDRVISGAQVTDLPDPGRYLSGGELVLTGLMWLQEPADCERFARFYKNKHEGRKLTWLWQLCKGEVKTNYIRNAKMPYIFQVSAYQMAILLLFNEKDRNTYEEIASSTALNAEALDPSLGILLKAKVLLLEGGGGKVGPGAVFALNYDFKNKKFRVNLNVGMKSETKQEEAETNKTIEEDRKLLLQVRPCPLFRPCCDGKGWKLTDDSPPSSAS